jgi:transcriptional regulator of acetoin/glycerol metabolism
MTPLSSSHPLSSPAPCQALIERATLAKVSPDSVRPEIRQSWQRCIDGGLDPGRKREYLQVQRDTLSGLREHNARLMQFAERELRKLQAQIPGSNYVIAFANSDAVILNAVFHNSAPDPASEVAPGVCWKESDFGTNAIGLAAIEKRPVTVHAWEHFFADYNHLTCTAAPVLAPDGDIAGILDVSSDSKSRRQHMSALVCMSALQIEAELFRERCQNHIVLQFHNRGEFVDTLQAGLIAVTDKGEILHTNSRARFFLEDLPLRVDGNFEEIFRSSFPDFLSRCGDGGVLTNLADLKGSCYSVKVHAPRRLHPKRTIIVGGAPHQVQLSSPDFVCEDPHVQQVLTTVRQAVHMSVPILIRGETGTGKELLARYAHSQCARLGKFVAVNCAAIPEDLIEAELFGYREGAFTGARSGGSQGLVQQAQHGTLFLDEIGDMPLRLQPALLRFLDQRTIRPVGSSVEQHVDCQIVAATHSDLEKAVSERQFRADLWHRISSVEVFLPALRERSDFRDLVLFSLRSIAPQVSITEEALTRLNAYDWPGNARELKNVLTRILISCPDQVITAEAVNALLNRFAPRPASFQMAAPPSLDAMRDNAILEAYHKFGGNVSKTARYLSMSRNTVYRRVRDLSH